MTEEIDITRIRSTFALSCCTHFAAALQQLHTYFRCRFLQQQLWFQLVAVGVSQPCTRFQINVLWGWNCNIQQYSCLIMGSSYVEFNAIDVEGSLPGSLPLLNKNTRIWSTFVILLIGQVFYRLLIHLLAAHILNLSDTASLRKFLAINLYSDFEICVVVLFRADLDSWLPDGSSTLFFRS